MSISYKETMPKILPLLKDRMLSALNRQAGFTMIELLVVIAVIGVLAVAVLSSINPVEQINKGRDTRTRSDAAQLINAVDRYYAIHEVYPWNTTTADYTSPIEDLPDEEFVFNAIDGTGDTNVGAEGFAWVDELVTTAEVKEGFRNRLINDAALVIFKEAQTNATMYSCFIPTSQAFKREAVDNCDDGVTPGGAGGPSVPAGITGVTCVSAPAVITEDNFLCLP